MKNLTIKLTFYLLIFLSFSCQSNKNQSSSENTEMIILHTNDMHAKIDNFPRLAFVVDSIRSTNPNVILVSAGDLFSGNVYVDQYEPKGKPIIDLMNEVGFELNVLGNHEFDYGQNILNDRIAQANFPMVCANLRNINAELKPMKAYEYLTFSNGTKVAFLGLLEAFVDSIPSCHPNKVHGLKFDNPLEVASDYAFLQDSADLYIALSHMGYEYDLKLAENNPEIDAVIGGHSHTKLDTGEWVNSVLVTQTGSYVKDLGVLRIKPGKTGKYEIKSEMISLSNGTEDRQIREKVTSYIENPYFKEKIHELDLALNGDDDLGRLMTDAFRVQGNADFGMQNSGGIRVKSFDAGAVTIGDVFALDPFGNDLLVLEMTNEEIKSLIMNGYKDRGEKVKVSGLEYEIKEGKVNLFDTEGNTMPEKRYKVAMNDYMYNAFEFDHVNSAKASGITTTEALIIYLKSLSEIGVRYN
ncbi:2',3'-cyclic-nucleotide 2'-phosphodiesterase (5'-nucleotidase family) [Aureibacter tunicatorum]|uniref:2',3'-cyclic-nucleotide 2'-phosphodiesterase (5'-nucleotidase family) n=2 Tax=Aureibacter tunicatorum TaxID=866807 RepID=A0AAE3XNQ7_9BACT|nr:2',3'-cyclic-nucleotide 2'-phosphodiesterase (5'-nucleotidase family) [Aureibacter tunicatorum]BDD04811.1 multifunctional 2',3'-cyclic-nucleotide 2'-phosphodiesterase/5'-nucleotidase/3'-nucleotidase [Aureibacter tunicatorum]